MGLHSKTVMDHDDGGFGLEGPSNDDCGSHRHCVSTEAFCTEQQGVWRCLGTRNGGDDLNPCSMYIDQMRGKKVMG